MSDVLMIGTCASQAELQKASYEGCLRKPAAIMMVHDTR